MVGTYYTDLIMSCDLIVRDGGHGSISGDQFMNRDIILYYFIIGDTPNFFTYRIRQNVVVCDK